MIYLTIVLGACLLLLLARFFNTCEFTWGEYGIGCVVLSAILGIGFLISTISQTSDTEIISGKVLEKKRETVSCSHSYPCHCRQQCSGSGQNRSCYEVCDTCYEHPYDIDWNVETTVGEININTIDSQGLIQPPRWTSAQIGEPVATTHTYTNWLLAAPNSIFKRKDRGGDGRKMPAYPLHVYDYYHIDRVVLDGVEIPPEQLSALNAAISENLKDIAKLKQVNLVIVLTNRDREFTENLRTAWLNGKKNDLVLVIGIKKWPTINWVDVFSWASDDLVNVKVRDDVRDYGVVDLNIVSIAMADINKFWIRKPMKTYEYLGHEVEISSAAIWILCLLGIVTIIGCFIIFTTKEIA